MLKDIYEWLLQEKKFEPKVIHSIREYERKNKCSPYTAIQKMELCSLGEIKEGVQAVFNLKPLSKPIAELSTLTSVSTDLMKQNRFIVMTDPSRQDTTPVAYILICNPLDRLTALDAVKSSGFNGKVAVRWITEDDYSYWDSLMVKNFASNSVNRLLNNADIVSSMGEEDNSIDDSSIDNSDDSQVVALVNEIISKAAELSASDVHMEPMNGGCRIRFRIDGVLTLFNFIPEKSLVRRVVNRMKVLGHMDVNNTRSPQSGKIKFGTYDIRVSTLPNVEGEKVVLRLLNSQQGAIRKLKELGFDDESEKKLRKMFLRPYGIILVSGPTGSGKSSTLAAVMSEINTEDVCMVTIEDPVEYRLKGATQVNVNPAAQLTFASVLRETLRQDPDIIMVGEIRDKETADIAMQASNTGHLVFSTIHTNSAISVITRLNDMGIDGYLVADNIVGIVSQSLIRKLCPHCKKKHIITKEDTETFYAPKSFIGQEVYWPGDGCDQCNGTGYAGRTVVFEILEITPQVVAAIHEHESTNKIEEIAEEQRFVKKIDFAYNLVREGKTSIQEVSRVLGGITSEETDN